MSATSCSDSIDDSDRPLLMDRQNRESSSSSDVLQAASEASKQAEMAAQLLKQLQGIDTKLHSASPPNAALPRPPPPPPTEPPPRSAQSAMNEYSARFEPVTMMQDEEHDGLDERVEIADYSSISVEDRIEAARRLSRYRRKKRRKKQIRRIARISLRITIVMTVAYFLFRYAYQEPSVPNEVEEAPLLGVTNGQHDYSDVIEEIDVAEMEVDTRMPKTQFVHSGVLEQETDLDQEKHDGEAEDTTQRKRPVTIIDQEGTRAEL